jgi:hypothetical protein
MGLPHHAGEEARDLVATVDWIERGDALAAAVGVKHGILGQQPHHPGDVAAARRQTKGLGEPCSLLR